MHKPVEKEKAAVTPPPPPVPPIPRAITEDMLHDLRRGDARMALRTLTAHLMSAAAAQLPDCLEVLKQAMPKRRQCLRTCVRAVAAQLEQFAESPFFKVPDV